ncbi:MAG: hypothetical protein VX589_06795 [Myxococcota bacterium]|nr:hypothetical protein [Myxococcota bacterium]
MDFVCRYLLLVGAVFASACAVKSGLDDGTWEATGKVSQASLVVQSNGDGYVDFTFEYLLGLVDDDGIQVVMWRYTLVDADRSTFGEVLEPMRDFVEGEQSPLFVEGTRQRRLPLDAGALQREKTYVLWIQVMYRDTSIYEHLVPVATDAPYEDGAPLDGLRAFEIGQ